MADLNDIGFEINDNDAQSVNTIDDCPSPPPPFHRPKVPIVEPPIIFTDHDQTITIQNIVPFDNIFFNDAKLYLFESTAAMTNSSTLNETARKTRGNFLQRMIHFFRSAINSPDDIEFNRQCEQLLNLTKYSCDMSDRIHIRILYTIYRRLTDSKEIFYSTHGPHWEQIGFQSSTPETDFRSTGLFSIFFLLYFVDSMYLPLAKQIYRLSHDEVQQFPFCCIGINLANILIKHLRHQTSRHTIRKILNEKISDTIGIDLSGRIFMALFLNFYLRWKQNNYTIVNTQQVLSELEQILNNRPKILFEEFDQFFRRKQNESM